VDGTAKPNFSTWLESVFPMVNDHPDVAGALRERRVIQGIGAALAAPFTSHGVTIVMSPEARGPILGALVARELRAGLVLARKVGQNHPGADIEAVSGPTWRGEPQHFQLRSADLSPTDVVMVVDDWITTGSSIRVLADTAASLGAKYVGAAAIVNKAEESVCAKLGVHTLVNFEALMSRT